MLNLELNTKAITTKMLCVHSFRSLIVTRMDAQDGVLLNKSAGE